MPRTICGQKTCYNRWCSLETWLGAVDLAGGRLQAEATFRGSLIIVGIEGDIAGPRQSICVHGVYSSPSHWEL